jgi:hypothetical protein
MLPSRNLINKARLSETEKEEEIKDQKNSYVSPKKLKVSVDDNF